MPIWRAKPFHVSTFRALAEQIAKLAYTNRDELLFFRGQDKDYQSKGGGTTLYPGIYRGDPVSARELRYRFDILNQASKLLVDRWKQAGIDGLSDLRRKRFIQWSILQHYQVAETPLIDITHSLRVACSFAQLNSTDPTCYVYVLGLPYVTNRITINSEHDLVNVRLLSICPPAALRPHFQEGFLAGTTDVTTDFDTKTELDFRNRLVAKFAIPRSRSRFWGEGFDQIPESALYPRRDQVSELCSKLRNEIRAELQPGDLGTFIKEWAELEELLLVEARRITERNLSVREAITVLGKHEKLPRRLAKQLHSIRSYRNNMVHRPETIAPKSVGGFLDRLQEAFAEARGLLG